MSSNKKYLGIDWGESKIGLAIGDSETGIAMPFRIAKDIEETLQAIEEEEIEALIVGKPFSLSGQNSEVSQKYMAFVENLTARSGLHISFVDERLTTKEAKVLMRGQNQGGKDDAVAAMLILQSFFDQLSGLKNNN